MKSLIYIAFLAVIILVFDACYSFGTIQDIRVASPVVNASACAAETTESVLVR